MLGTPVTRERLMAPTGERNCLYAVRAYVVGDVFRDLSLSCDFVYGPAVVCDLQEVTPFHLSPFLVVRVSKTL